MPGTGVRHGSTSPIGGGTIGSTSPIGGGTTGGGTTGGSTTGGGATGGRATAGTLTGSGTTGDGLTASDISSATAMSGGTVGPYSLSGGAMSGGPPALAAGLVRLRDVARVERGAQSYTSGATFDGRPSVGLAVFQLPGTNALDVADRVRKKMDDLKTRFPEGVDYNIAYDTTPFIRESVMDVVRTLFEAVGLVAIVVLLFLQNWRAALIPLIAVPVAIVGTFAVMAALHFSLNNISLFGLVLAIGIVVDDAIVVVENVERWLGQGLPPREATRKAMDEVTGPVVAVALVLCAVFVPCAFIGGITGQFFRQFAVTIAVSTVFSAFNSLTLSPALAALLLRPHGARRDPLTWLLDLVLGWFFRLFNSAFGAATAIYTRAVGGLLRVSVLALVVYGGLLVLTYWVFGHAPTGFVPEQDQGRLIVNVQLPDSASLQRTEQTLALVEQIARQMPGVAHTTTVSGTSLVLSANSSNFATLFVILDPFAKRQSPELSGNAIAAWLRQEYARQVKDGAITVFGAPAIPGLGVAGGFQLMVEDRGGSGLTALQGQTDTLVGKLREDPALVGVLTQFRSNTPMLYMDVDRTKVESLGVSLEDLNQTMQIYMGSLYVNSYNEFGREWQVNLQAEGSYRSRVTDVNLLQVRNKWGEMVPLGTLVHFRDVGGPVMVQRYNLYTAAPINGNVRPGVSSGEAIATIDAAAAQTLPRSMSTEWTLLMFLQIKAGNTAMYVFALAVVFVFLALAGAVRGASAAAGRHPRRAAVPALLPGRGAVHRQGRRHLRADRPGRAGRPGVQERHPHCRIRPGVARGGEGTPRGDVGGRAAATAADPDDFVRLHPGRGPPGDRHGRRRRDAPLAGNGRLQRHGRRDLLRHLPDPRVLLRHPVARRSAGVLLPRHAPGRARAPSTAQHCHPRHSGSVRPPVRPRTEGAEAPRSGPSAPARNAPYRGGNAMISHHRHRPRPSLAVLFDRHHAGGGSRGLLVAGAAAAAAPPPPLDVTPPTVQVTAVSSRGERPIPCRTRGAADREPGERGRGAWLTCHRSANDGSHTLTVTFKLGMDFGHGPGAGAEPRLAGAASHPGPGAASGNQRPEDDAQPANDCEPVLTRWGGMPTPI